MCVCVSVVCCVLCVVCCVLCVGVRGCFVEEVWHECADADPPVAVSWGRCPRTHTYVDTLIPYSPTTYPNLNLTTTTFASTTPTHQHTYTHTHAPTHTHTTHQVKLGLIPATISPYVVAKIGEFNARRYFMTAERLDAAESMRVGLLQVRRNGRNGSRSVSLILYMLSIETVSYLARTWP